MVFFHRLILKNFIGNKVMFADSQLSRSYDLKSHIILKCNLFTKTFSLNSKYFPVSQKSYSLS